MHDVGYRMSEDYLGSIKLWGRLGHKMNGKAGRETEGENKTMGAGGMS